MKRSPRLARVRPDQARRRPAPPEERVIEVAEVGGKGDGVALGESGPTYTPLTLPGERVRVRVVADRGELVAVESASAERQEPPCGLFGRCGGCQLQHWAEAPYLAWKHAQVVQALERRGVEAPVEPITPAWGEGRRRVVLHAARVQGKLRFGFVARGGAQIIDVDACPAMAPALAAVLPALRKIASMVAPERGEANLTCLATDSGVDCDIKGAREPQRNVIAAIAEASAGLARVSLDGAPLAMQRRPLLKMGRALVTPPPGAFTQPTAAGEEALAARALEALGPAKRIADLFSGIGTFALRAAAQGEVHALDSETVMLDALKAAADAATLPARVTRRDLLRTPLSALELKHYDAALFDPPRSGARLQAAEIAKSKIARVAAISCDAATFARDARVLIDGGFKLVRVSPVDQFRWTPHVEIVGAFER